MLGEKEGNMLHIKQGEGASHVMTAVGVAEDLHDNKFRSLHKDFLRYQSFQADGTPEVILLNGDKLLLPETSTLSKFKVGFSF